MKLKLIMSSFFVVLLLSLSSLAQKSPVSSVIPSPLQQTRVDFRGCFYLDNDSVDSPQLLKNIEVSKSDPWKIQSKICKEDKLGAYIIPVFHRQSADFRNEEIEISNEGILKPRMSKNVSVKYNGRSGNVFFLVVKINNQPEQNISLKESEIAFVPAGLLDPENQKSRAYLAVSVKFFDSLK